MHTIEEPSDVAVSKPPARAPERARERRSWHEPVREFLLILASVLTALAAQALWESHQERVRERDYLRQILVDTRQNERLLNAAVEEDSLHTVASVRLMRALAAPGPLPPRDTLVDWIGSAASASDYQLQAGTLHALLGSGDLHLVRNDSLRGLLADHQAFVGAQADRLQEIRRMTFAQIPAYVHAVPFLQRLYAFGRVQPSPGELERLRGDTAFRETLFVLQSALLNRLRGLAALQASTRRLRNALEAEPGVGDVATPAKARPR